MDQTRRPASPPAIATQPRLVAVSRLEGGLVAGDCAGAHTPHAPLTASGRGGIGGGVGGGVLPEWPEGQPVLAPGVISSPTLADPHRRGRRSQGGRAGRRTGGSWNGSGAEMPGTGGDGRWRVSEEGQTSTEDDGIAGGGGGEGGVLHYRRRELAEAGVVDTRRGTDRDGGSGSVLHHRRRGLTEAGVADTRRGMGRNGGSGSGGVRRRGESSLR